MYTGYERELEVSSEDNCTYKFQEIRDLCSICIIKSPFKLVNSTDGCFPQCVMNTY